MALDHRKTAFWDCVQATFLWLALGFSVGWYYTYTFYTDSSWPLPLPEACAGLILYYFSAFTTRPWIQIAHWMVVFAVAGFLWVNLLMITAPFFGGKRGGDYTWTLLRFAVTGLPLIIPGPVLAGMAGRTLFGYSWRHIIEVALHRAGAFYSPKWLTPLYMGLAVVCLLWQIALYVRVFEVKPKQAALHYLLSVILLACAACGLATFAAFPLEWWLK